MQTHAPRPLQTRSLPSRERGLKLRGTWPGSNATRSLPSRERGLKSKGYFRGGKYVSSLPSRERGLKFHAPHLSTISHAVAPFAGAWIEILLGKAAIKQQDVAPFAGAWIEIAPGALVAAAAQGRSLRGSVD